MPFSRLYAKIKLHSFKRALLCSAFMLAAPLSGAHAEDRAFDIPQQSLSKALLAFSQQSNIIVTAPASIVEGKRAPALKGAMPPERALDALLSGSGLKAMPGADGVVVIQVARRDERADTNAARDASGAMLAQENRGSAGTALAQAQPDRRADDVGGGRIEEVIVTAQRRSERLIDVPISIVAVGAEELQNRRVSSVDDLQAVVPGLTIVGAGGQQRRIMLRGLSNTFGRLIGSYLDEVALSPNNVAAEFDLRTYDLERVEVLRGPQGTLYGVGSVGGTIRFITRDPRLDRSEATFDAAASFTNDGGPSQKLEGMVNVPLVEDEAALRIAGTVEHQGGWMEQPALRKKNINQQDLVHVRIKGLWQPTPEFTINVMGVVHRNDGSLGSYSEDAAGNFTQYFNFATTPSVQDNYEIYNVTMTYDLDSVRLLSSSSYTEQAKQGRDFGSGAQIAAPPAPRRSFYYFNNDSAGQTVIQELRLTSQDTGPLQWTLGGFYSKSEIDGLLIYTLDGVNRVFNPSASSVESTALFGDASYEFASRFKLGAGLRYFEDDQESQSAAAVGTRPATLPAPRTTGFDTLNPRVYAQYKWADNINTYASAAKGFRSGALNPFATQRDPEPEVVWSYELGTKLASDDGRMTADAALFYSDYTNYQVVGLVPTPPTGALLNSLANAGKISVKGIEFGGGIYPTENLFLSVNATYTKSRFRSIAAQNTAFAVGDSLDLVPKYSFTVSAQYDWDVNSRPAFVRLDYSQQGRTHYRNRNLAGPTPWYYGESDVINLLNFNSRVQVTDRLSLGVFAENIFNDRGLTNPFAVTDNIATRQRPFTMGVQAGLTF